MVSLVQTCRAGQGQVKVKGPVSKILELIPISKPLFPIYKNLVTEKDAQRS